MPFLAQGLFYRGMVYCFNLKLTWKFISAKHTGEKNIHRGI